MLVKLVDDSWLINIGMAIMVAAAGLLVNYGVRGLLCSMYSSLTPAAIDHNISSAVHTISVSHVHIWLSYRKHGGASAAYSPLRELMCLQVIGSFSKISKSTKQGLLLGYFASAGTRLYVFVCAMAVGCVDSQSGRTSSFSNVFLQDQLRESFFR
jgi:hypothetical protein